MILCQQLHKMDTAPNMHSRSRQGVWGKGRGSPRDASCFLYCALTYPVSKMAPYLDDISDADFNSGECIRKNASPVAWLHWISYKVTLKKQQQQLQTNLPAGTIWHFVRALHLTVRKLCVWIDIQCLQKVFKPLNFFHILLGYSKID